RLRWPPRSSPPASAPPRWLRSPPAPPRRSWPTSSGPAPCPIPDVPGEALGPMSAFSSLTTRGRAFLAAGIAAALCSLFLGQKDLLRVAIFLIALPVVTVFLVARTHYRIAATRSLDPARVPAGSQATVRLRLENVGRMPTGPLLLEDRIPYAL